VEVVQFVVVKLISVLKMEKCGKELRQFKKKINCCKKKQKEVN
jgi:hypothetical protein